MAKCRYWSFSSFWTLWLYVRSSPIATVIATCRKLTWEEIVALYRLTLDQPAVNTRARFNDCPTTTIDTILDQDGKRRLERMRWALIPLVVVEAAQGNEACHF